MDIRVWDRKGETETVWERKRVRERERESILDANSTWWTVVCLPSQTFGLTSNDTLLESRRHRHQERESRFQDTRQQMYDREEQRIALKRWASLVCVPVCVCVCLFVNWPNISMLKTTVSFQVCCVFIHIKGLLTLINCIQSPYDLYHAELSKRRDCNSPSFEKLTTRKWNNDHRIASCLHQK